MREAVIVSTARTAIGRAFRGALNNIKSPTLLGHALRHAVERARVDGNEIDDVVVGSVLNAGTAGLNVARNAAIAAGIPVTAGAQTIDRQCASGLTAIAAGGQADRERRNGDRRCGRTGEHLRRSGTVSRVAGRGKDANVTKLVAHAYMPMLQTAEFVARKYAISRKRRTRLRSRRSSARRVRRPRTVRRRDRSDYSDDGGRRQGNEGRVASRSHAVQGRGKRPETTLSSLAALAPVIDGRNRHRGNASQLSDGASACVLVEAKLASAAVSRRSAPIAA
jgi:acetyl-CoA acetyltransferase